jgi:hypothetical protein
VYVKPCFVTPIGLNASRLRAKPCAQCIVHLANKWMEIGFLWLHENDYYMFVFQKNSYNCAYSILILNQFEGFGNLSTYMIWISSCMIF